MKINYPKKAKYKSLSCKCAIGHIHDSRGEARYCDTLQHLLGLKAFHSIEYQVSFPMVANGKKICVHKVDFLITDDKGKQTVHEYKGFATDVWKLKHKLFLALYPEIEYKVIRHR